MTRNRIVYYLQKGSVMMKTVRSTPLGLLIMVQLIAFAFIVFVAGFSGCNTQLYSELQAWREELQAPIPTQLNPER